MVMEIPLSRGMVALVDDEDYERVTAEGPWSASECSGKFYARRQYRDQYGLRHWLTVQTLVTGWRLVDHINGDGLDNTRANLRPATPRENAQNQGLSRRNTTGYKGVHFYRRTGRYRAYIGAQGITYHLGYFTTPEEGARAYDAAARDLFGEFARLNFPLENAS